MTYINRRGRFFTLVAIVLLAELLVACSSGSSSGGGNTAPVLTLSSPAVTEGSSGKTNLEFIASLDQPAGSDVSVDFTTEGDTATAGEDFTPLSGTLVIPSGTQQGSVLVEVLGDICFEDAETLRLRLSNPSANVSLNSNNAIGTIGNDDNKPRLSIADTSSLEGNTGSSNMSFAVNLDKPGCSDISVDYASSNVTATAPDDYATVNDVLIIPAYTSSAEILVPVNGDTAYESDETLTVTLANLSTNAVMADDAAFGTIQSDDAPTLYVSSPAVLEGDSGTTLLTFSVTLQGPTNEVTLHYATADGTATVAGNDYQPATGDLVIPAGTTNASISVVINGDTANEGNENLTLQLSLLSGTANLNATSALGVIIDNNVVVTPAEGLRTHYAQVTEGALGANSDLIFAVTLDAALPNAVSFNYLTSDIDATAGTDYVAASGTATIPAGATEVLIPVTVNGDDVEEGDETLTLTISNITGNVNVINTSAVGRILDDDAVASTNPRINTTSAIAYEGNAGTSTTLIFSVALNTALASDVTLDYTTSDDSALAGSDYTATSGTLTIPAGTTVMQIPVDIIGDDFVEADERFNLVLSNAVGATLGTTQLVGTILTDDPFARIWIDDLSATEGDLNTTVDMNFTVSLSVPAADPVSVDYTIVDYSTDAADYIMASGQLLIPAGLTSGTITVTVNGDADVENDEKFIVALSNPSANAELSDAQGEGAIINDDGNGGWGIMEKLEPYEDPSGGGASANDVSATTPALAMNDSGEAIAVWRQNFPPPDVSQPMSRSYLPGSGWQVDTASPGIDGAIPQLFMDAGGNSIALFNGFASGLIVNHHSAVNGWDAQQVVFDIAPIDVLHSRAYNIVGNANGQAAVLLQAVNALNSSYSDIWIVKYDPINGWDLLPTRLDSTDTERDGSPAAAMDANGNIMVVWEHTPPGLPHDIIYRYYDAQSDTWTLEAVAVADTTYSALEPQLVALANGEFVTAWVQATASGGELRVSTFDPALTSWSLPLSLGVPALGSIELATNPNGDIFACWKNFSSVTGTSDIWGAHFDPAANAGLGAWTAGLLEQDDLNHAAEPRIAADPLGNAIVVWTQDDGTGLNNLRSARFDTVLNDWQPAETLEFTTPTHHGHTQAPQVSMDGSGNAIVVWKRTDWSDIYNALWGASHIWTIRYTRP